MNFNIPTGTEHKRGYSAAFGQHDQHVIALRNRQRLAAFARANDAMAEGIRRAGSVSAFLAQESSR